MELNRINKMTFNELRNELAKCDDPVKETLIRNLMYIRYKQHINKKIQIDEIKRRKMLRFMEQQKKKIETNTINNNSINDLLNDEDNLSLDPDEFEIKQTSDSLNELDDADELLDKRNITEYERDMVNNNIVERLNSDIDIRTMRETQQKKEFVVPYSDNDDGNYAPFNSKPKLQVNTFSNRRPKKN